MLKSTLGPLLCIHSLFPSLILFRLSVVIYVVDVSSKNAIYQLSAGCILGCGSLRTEIVANHLEFIIIRAVL